MSASLFEKLWQIHEVAQIDEGEYLINIDRIFLHERTGSIALQSLEESGRQVLSPQNVFCTMDHIVSTKPGRGDRTEMPSGQDFIIATRASAHKSGINFFDLDHPNQGIMHVVSPELGIALPGSTMICPDSHTCTLGALGALAWGVGSTDAEHALATNTMRVKKPKTMRVVFEGELSPACTAKDLILHFIGLYGASGGAGYAVEFTGSVIRNLPMEARMTVCNMAVEFSAFTGLIAVDDDTIRYVQGRKYAPSDTDWSLAEKQWRQLVSDEGAVFDKEIVVDCVDISPTVTWGSSPEQVVAIKGSVPDPDTVCSESQKNVMIKALSYMGLKPGAPIEDIKIEAAFIGSCTNSRVSDLRAVANFLKGKKVASGVSAICVPGSSLVKRQAEIEGLDKVFVAAGFEWRESGCSMCFYAGGETFGANKRVISSTNRNFESRQGPGVKTHLASPLTVAASACAGFIRQADAEPGKASDAAIGAA